MGRTFFSLSLLLLCLSSLVVSAQDSKDFQLNPGGGANTTSAIGDKFALLIGVKAYENGIRPLQYTENDITALYEVLVDPERGGFPRENVIVLSDSRDRKPTLIEINKALNELAASALNDDDIVLIYFTGHGETDGELSYLLTPDTDPGALQFSALQVPMFNKMIERIPAGKKVIILDACHAGGVSMQSKGSGSLTAEMYRDLHARSKGEVRLLSCGESELSYETEKLGGGRGVFSHFLVKALSTPDADKDGNGLVTITELEDYVKINVPRWAGSQGWKQTPTSEKKVEGMLVIGKVPSLEMQAETIGAADSRGDSDDTVAEEMISYAKLYESQQQHERAIRFYTLAAEITEDSLGESHPFATECAVGLARNYKAIGEEKQAERFQERALSLSELAMPRFSLSLGDQHPDDATNLTNQASILVSMGDYQQALPLYEQALAIREKAFGPDHPSTASSLTDLAMLHKHMGNSERALALFQRALAVREQTLGPNHPETAASLNNLALLYQTIGENEKALALYKRSLSLLEKTLGPEHPAVRSAVANLAQLYESMGDLESAGRLRDKTP